MKYLILGIAFLQFESCGLIQFNSKSDARIIGNDDEPNYPKMAEANFLNGLAVLEFVINSFGKVDSIKVIQDDPIGFGFADSSIAQLKKIKFIPAFIHNKPVSQRMKRKYVFNPLIFEENAAVQKKIKTYSYKDLQGRNYTVNTIDGKAFSAFVYEKNGKQIESDIWESINKRPFLYSIDTPTVEFPDTLTGC